MHSGVIYAPLFHISVSSESPIGYLAISLSLLFGNLFKEIFFEKRSNALNLSSLHPQIFTILSNKLDFFKILFYD